MDTTPRFDEVLLITRRTFQPYQCVAQSELGSDSGLSLFVADHTGTRLLDHARIPSSAYSDPEQLADLLQQARKELSHSDCSLQDWSISSQG